MTSSSGLSRESESWSACFVTCIIALMCREQNGNNRAPRARWGLMVAHSLAASLHMNDLLHGAVRGRVDAATVPHAAEFGVSDTALRKMCDRRDIPTPAISPVLRGRREGHTSGTARRAGGQDGQCWGLRGSRRARRGGSQPPNLRTSRTYCLGGKSPRVSEEVNGRSGRI